MFHQLAHLPSRFCQIPICPVRIGQTVEHIKFKSIQPSPRADESPCRQFYTPRHRCPERVRSSTIKWPSWKNQAENLYWWNHEISWKSLNPVQITGVHVRRYKGLRGPRVAIGRRGRAAAGKWHDQVNLVAITSDFTELKANFELINVFSNCHNKQLVTIRLT